MALFSKLIEHDYQQVVFCNDNSAGLRGIIAIHNTTLGPALGGVRMRPYASEDDALEDVLRLARGMTFKAAISDSRTTCEQESARPPRVNESSRHAPASRPSLAFQPR